MKPMIPAHIALALASLTLSASVISAQMEDAAHMHAHHHMPERTQHRAVDYKVPDVQLVRDDGKSISLAQELNDGRPVVLNFIYTTCTTICPVTSHTFSELQEKLGNEREQVHMVSISIDPEQDTPAVLARYALKYGAGSQWRFYTGTLEASIAAQRAFDVYRGDKMDHGPVTFVRLAPGRPWLRIDGFAKSDELLLALHGTKSEEQMLPHAM